MVSKSKQDEVYMEMAIVLSKFSNARRKQVGCLIVRHTQILSEGVNGTPWGFDNTCEDDDGNTKREVLHAESNALMKLCRTANNSLSSTVYTTLEPCFDCAKLMLQAEVSRVVYLESYVRSDGVPLLKQAGIQVDHLGAVDEA
jgi:dCMP deaminase